jgi:hypothetical protein
MCICPSAKPIQPAAIATRPITSGEAHALEDLETPIRQQQEAVLIELVNATPDDDPDKPEVLFRLAQHYSLQQRFWRLRSVELLRGTADDGSNR